MTARRVVVSLAGTAVAAILIASAIGLTGKGLDAGSAEARRIASACREFNETVTDTRSGVATDHEVDRRMQKVYDTGRGSESSAARATFAAFQHARLSGEEAAIYDAVSRMSALCHTKW
ncbi:MAG TPA: hypothetical protein VIF11_01270 [Methylomirabilota bacterium]|jgi:hypothetical protein